MTAIDRLACAPPFPPFLAPLRSRGGVSFFLSGGQIAGFPL